MKRIVVIIAILSSTTSFSQNTFPASGNVGIGMSNPLDLLHIADGNLRIGTEIGDYGRINYTGGAMAIFNHWVDDNAYIRLGAGNVLANVHIMGNGNVGIGIINPQDRLHLADGSIRIGTDLGDYGEVFYSGGGMTIQNRWASNNAYIQLGAGNSLSNVNIMGDGKVGIGTLTPDAKLTVKGDIHTQEVNVDLLGAVAPDFVFEEDYELQSLEATEAYIKANKHLPEIPSAKEMEANGLDLKEMNLKLLQKVEELTLHLIEQNKEIKVLKEKVAELGG